ncbi:ABC transporter ATP-binding protein [uncultured Oscillibacter sp.]|uniref:ABC transporter ATP-binding protein n=1 Tax=uncultured Oscillibacter sp. TaxID=876091 RepID=UPI00280C0618|nr:ABC transporter ATP-binding protein [uncultured Oscillibacter sp.]
MTRKLQHWFALSEKGAKDLVKAVFWCFVCNLALMFPIGVILFTAQHLLACMEHGGSSMDGFWLYVGFALAVLLLLFTLHWFQYASLYISTYQESANRRVGLAETLRKLPLSFFGNRDLSDLASTMISDCSSLDQMFSHYIPQLFASIASTLVIGVCMFLCDWRMAVAVLWVVPVAVALTAGSKRIQDDFGTKNILNKRAVADCIQEGLETIRDIKACRRQERYLRDLEEKLSAMEGSAIRSELATGVFVCSAQAFLRLGLATTVLTGGALLLAGQLSFLYFLGFLFAAARLYDPLGLVLQSIAATFNAILQIQRMRSILEQPVQTGTEDFYSTGYDITFDHVSFAYRNGAEVLDDVSFTARQGEVTALIGSSGSGKSTACKLAARFWDVSGGKVSLGGTDVSTVDPEALLRSYSMVFQDVVLFRDTVMENIRLGRRGASDEEVLKAAKAAQCDAFIRKLPQGYQTVIGENGTTLSGGERQRISIARALLKDAPVVLLDEATASLDVENESAVQAALSCLLRDKTVLVIAHRMRTVAGADHIVVLGDGRVIQQGSPSELMEQGGLYRRMVELQSQSAQWRLSCKE